MAFLNALKDLVFGKRDPVVAQKPDDERPSTEGATASEDHDRVASNARAIDWETPAADRRAPMRGPGTLKLKSRAATTAVQAFPVGGEPTRPKSPAAPDSVDASTSAGMSAGPAGAPRTNKPAASASEEFRETWVSSPKKAAKPKPRGAGRAPPPGPEHEAPVLTATFKPAALERARRIAAQLRESPEQPSEADVEPPVTNAAAEDPDPMPPASSPAPEANPMLLSPGAETELARPEAQSGLQAARMKEAAEEPLTTAALAGQDESECVASREASTDAVAGLTSCAPDVPEAVAERPLNLGAQDHDPLLTDLVRRNPTSVRLENAILNGETAGALPCKTVLEYVGDPASRARFLRCVANFGRLSADELDRLVGQAHRQLLRQQTGFKMPDGGELVSTAALRNAVLALFAGRDTDDVLAPFPLPARFQNALFMRGWLALPFPEFLSNFPQRCTEMLSQSNVGCGSVEAGRALVQQAIIAELSSRGVEAAALDPLLAAVLDDRDLSQVERQVAAAGLLRGATFDAGAAAVDANGEEQRPRLPLGTDAELIVAVAELFGDAAVGDMIGPFIPPARLENGLRIHGYLEKPYRDMLLDFPGLEREMLRLPNMGRTSLAAWRKIAASLLESRLGRLGLGRASIDEVSALIIQGRPMSAQARRAAAAELDRSGADGVGGEVRAQPDPVPPKPPEELLQPLMAVLNERTQEVIRRRYGLDGRPRETLEQISQTYEVTRERIRQIEQKALRILRLQTQAELESSLKLYGEQAWRAMTARRILTQAELPQRRRRLCGWFEIALDAAKLDLHDWLDDYAQRVPAGWAAPNVDLGRLEAARHAIRARSHNQRSPYALQSVRLDQSNLGLEDIRLAAELEGRRLFGDYIVSGYLGPRARRTVQIHALLAEARRPLEVVKALADYIARFPSDPCSARDLELVMQDHPRLFLEVQEGVWAALGRFGAAPLQAAHSEPDLEVETADPDATDEGDAPEEKTVAEAIFAELRRSGPQRISILMERAPDFLPPGRSSYSVGPILLSHKDLFARPLPGVYALHDQVLDEACLMEAKPAYLFDERHVRNYVMARNAGEPFGAYALWTPAVEYLWCCWARRHADSSLLEALLSVADPAAWPETEDRESWRALKAQRGRYALHVSPRDESYGLPELEHVLSACLLIREHRRLTWVSGNRAQFRRPADHTSAGLLALLVAVGALQDGAPHWQAAHDIGPELSVVLERLEDERVRLGVLHWQGEAGQALLAQARRFSPRDGWVTADRVERLVGDSQPDPAEPQFPTATGAGDFLDQLLAEESQRHQAARLAGALAELGNEDGEAS